MGGQILSAILGVLTGKAGEKIGNAVSGIAQFAALAAALAPVLLWLQKNGDDIFIAITYKDIAFWGALFGLFALVVVRLVHRAPPP